MMKKHFLKLRILDQDFADANASEASNNMDKGVMKDKYLEGFLFSSCGMLRFYATGSLLT